MASSTSGPCAYCDCPGRTLKCDLCADAPTKDLKRTRTTFFCNEECKSKIWESHQKDTCKAGSTRKALKLFADTLQKAWIIICKETSNLVMLQAQQVSPKELHVHVGPPEGLTQHLPSHIWSTLSSNDRAAILTASNGNRCDAFANCDAMLKAYIAGLCEQIEEMIIVIEDPERLVTMVVRGVDERNHELTVLKVALKHGAGQFIVSLSGAQFGFYDCLVPYQTFCERHAQNPMLTTEWGLAGLQKYHDLCIYHGPVPPVLTTAIPEIIGSRTLYIFEAECVELMNTAMRARGYLATMTPEKVNQILASDMEWQKAFLTNVEAGIRRGVEQAKDRVRATSAECMMRYVLKDPCECPPFSGYGNYLSYDKPDCRPAS